MIISLNMVNQIGEIAGPVAAAVAAVGAFDAGIHEAGDVVHDLEQLEARGEEYMEYLEEYYNYFAPLLAASLPSNDVVMSKHALIEVGPGGTYTQSQLPFTASKRGRSVERTSAPKRSKSYHRSQYISSRNTVPPPVSRDLFDILAAEEAKEDVVMVDEVPQTKAEYSMLVRSLTKSSGMPYRTRRRRLRRKRKKFVTKRGVRALIARDKHSHGQYITRQTHQSMQCLSTFNDVGRSQYNFFLESDLNTLITEAKLIYATTAVTGGAGQPQDNIKLWYRKVFRTIMIHSSVNEVQYVCLWWIRSNQDQSAVDPVTRWSTEYGEKNPASGTGSLPFINNFMTYPTAFKQWNNEFTIVKKVKFILQAGQTVKWKVKQMPNTYVAADYNTASTNALKGHTYWLMVETKGVPTQDNTTSTLVGKSLTGVDITMDSSYQIGLSDSGSQKATYSYGNYGTIAAASTSTTSTAIVMSNTI